MLSKVIHLKTIRTVKVFTKNSFVGPAWTNTRVQLVNNPPHAVFAFLGENLHLGRYVMQTRLAFTVRQAKFQVFKRAFSE